MLAAGDEPFELSFEDFQQTFVHPDDREWSTRTAEAALLSGEPLAWERRLIRRDGEVIWEASHVGYELDEEGRPLRMIGAVQDITDRVRLVEELRKSRARIVEAAAEERLRLERDLHDGAQNRLVTIQMKLAEARRQAGAGALARDLDELIEDAQAAIEELRALGHGIYPTELRERGLEHALRSLADAAPIPVRVIAGEVGRHAPMVEEAVFFCAREAIQNAAKHAGARAHVTLSLKAATTTSSSKSPTTAPGSIRSSSRPATASRACATASAPSAASSRSPPRRGKAAASAGSCRAGARPRAEPDRRHAFRLRRGAAMSGGRCVPARPGELAAEPVEHGSCESHDRLVVADLRRQRVGLLPQSGGRRRQLDALQRSVLDELGGSVGGEGQLQRQSLELDALIPCRSHWLRRRHDRGECCRVIVHLGRSLSRAAGCPSLVRSRCDRNLVTRTRRSVDVSAPRRPASRRAPPG